MKVVAYSVKSFEKEFLAKSNQKKHDITLISNPLSLETTMYAEGKDAIMVFTNDDVSAPVVHKLADMGIRYIATRSVGTDHIDREAAGERGIKIANVPAYSPEAVAEHTLALAFALNRHVVQANEHSHHFNFKLENLMGFNFHGKTVGIVGLGHIGLATAGIFKGMGCQVLGYDVAPPDAIENIQIESLTALLQQSDIVSLHVPLTPQTHHLINREALAMMKHGVMLLNTSRGGLIDTEAVLQALTIGKVGYLGIDVYEKEKGLFFQDHSKDAKKDPLLEKLIAMPNVLVTPHQAFLTKEALQQIADRTIKNLDQWQQNKCVGDACACAKSCRESKVVETVGIVSK